MGADSRQPSVEAKRAAESLATLKAQVHRVIVGQEALLEGVFISMLCGGHVSYVPAGDVRPANDGLPDFNLTADGSQGRDVG